MGKSNTVTAQIHYKGSNKDIKMIITLKEVMSYKPCPGSNPEQYGIKRISLVNLLKKEEIPAEDRVWAACHVLARKDIKLLVSFANNCAVRAADAANAAADYAANADEQQRQIDWLIEKLRETYRNKKSFGE